jgi:hypothetical protein
MRCEVGEPTLAAGYVDSGADLDPDDIVATYGVTLVMSTSVCPAEYSVWAPLSFTRL